MLDRGQLVNKLKKLGILLALSGSLVATPSVAQCWDGPSLAAARVRDLQTMLMAATLRCHAVGMDISAHYNGFVTARHAQLDLANAMIKGHFSREGGQTAYDHFATSLANAYGDASTTQAACDEAAQTADDAAGSSDTLFALADQRSDPPQEIDGACAAHETVAALAPAPRAAAPSQAEVTAALEVLNRYQAVQTGLMLTAAR